MCDYVRGEHHSNIPGCTTAISPIPRPISGTQRIIQRAPPLHPERHSSFYAARDLTFDMLRVKLDQIRITFYPLLGPSGCRTSAP